jgi:DNA helicase MCM9
MTPNEYRYKYRKYLDERCITNIENTLLKKCGPEEHIAFEINCNDFIDFDTVLSFSTIAYPKLLLPIFEEALIESEQLLLKTTVFLTKHGGKGTMKNNIHIRLISLPPTDDISKNSIGEIKATEVGPLLQLPGTVVRTGTVRMLEVSKMYECQNPKCSYRFRVYADPEQNNLIPQPRLCPSKPHFSSSTTTAIDQQQQQQIENAGMLDPLQRKPTPKWKCNSTNLREVSSFSMCMCVIVNV